MRTSLCNRAEKSSAGAVGASASAGASAVTISATRPSSQGMPTTIAAATMERSIASSAAICSSHPFSQAASSVSGASVSCQASPSRRSRSAFHRD